MTGPEDHNEAGASLAVVDRRIDHRLATRRVDLFPKRANEPRVDIAFAPQSSEADFIYRARQSLVADPPDIRLDCTVAYDMGGSLSVPPHPGVYLIHDLRGVLYVGRTNDLHQRYFQHYWGSHNGKVTAALRRPVGRLEFSWNNRCAGANRP